MTVEAEPTGNRQSRGWHLLSGRQRAALVGLLVLAVIALLAPSPFAGRAAMTIFDLFHFPAFAAISWLALRIGRRLGMGRMPQRLAIAVVILLASAILEGLQAVSGRSATLHDLVANAAGVLAGWMVFEAALCERWPRRYSLRSAALALWITTSFAPARVLHDLWKQDREFPLIGSFESDAELTRWWRRSTSMSRGQKLVTDGRTGLTLQVQAGPYPAMLHMHLPPDWSTYTALQFDWGVPAECPTEEVQLLVRIADSRRSDTPQDTFQRTYRMRRGQQRRIHIPLAEIQQGPSNGSLDLKAIQILEFQFLDIHQPVVVHFDNIRLI